VHCYRLTAADTWQAFTLDSYMATRIDVAYSIGVPAQLPVVYAWGTDKTTSNDALVIYEWGIRSTYDDRGGPRWTASAGGVGVPVEDMKLYPRSNNNVLDLANAALFVRSPREPDKLLQFSVAPDAHGKLVIKRGPDNLPWMSRGLIAGPAADGMTLMHA